jgi:glucose/arabinose dehydrogenase
MKQVMKRAGAATPSADRITLLRGLRIDGSARSKAVFIEHLTSPFGMALVGADLYVANSDAIVRFPYVEGATRIEAGAARRRGAARRAAQPPLDQEQSSPASTARISTRTVGSNSNVGENGMAAEEGRAAIWAVRPQEAAPAASSPTGLRNPNGMAWGSDGTLGTVANERDEIGSDLVPDYLTSVRDGAFYGWPYSYYGPARRRARPAAARPTSSPRRCAPDYALGRTRRRSASRRRRARRCPRRSRTGCSSASTARGTGRPHSGYKVIFVPFDSSGRPAGEPIDVLTGFLTSDGDAKGRPVGVAIDKTGALLVADDVGNTVWRVAAPGR